MSRPFPLIGSCLALMTMLTAVGSVVAQSDGIELLVSPGPASGELNLTWTGPPPRFEVFRSFVPNSVIARANLIDASVQTSLSVTLGGPETHFYMVTGPCLCVLEVCDGVDNDCNDVIDDVDFDGDGFVDALCGGSDCDDGQPLVYPGAPELCGDGLDNDCNGAIDDKDVDGDGHVDSQCIGYVGALPRDDCNDTELLVHPGATEICGDGLDNDCDSYVDNADVDSDNFIDFLCGGRDCDDTQALVNPSESESCNNLDNDCNGATDDKDLDGDGHIDANCTGYIGLLPIDDCDDTAPLVHPGTNETCGDGLDNDCSGAIDDKDADADGFLDPACGGTDCDDTAPLIYPGADEIYDTKDSDCDGLVDEGVIPPGSLIISEIMQDPVVVPDLPGEWFEIHNTSTNPVNMDTWVIRDLSVPPGVIVVTAPAGLIVPPSGTVVLCATGNLAVNGGVTCDYAYDTQQLGLFSLSNASDEIILSIDGVEIDRVEYDGGPSFPDPSGRSISLDPSAYDDVANDNGTNWCATPAVANYQLPGGDHGTPGQVNPSCTGGLGVVGIQPAAGPDDGGQSVTIHGSGFVGATAVTLGGTACAQWLVLSDTAIECVTPSSTAGDVDVEVARGAQSDVLIAGYRFTGETVNVIDSCSLLPASATTGVGQPTALLFGQVFATGVTEPVGPPAGIHGQVGYGPITSDPRSHPGWTWVDAVWSSQVASNDEFMMTLTVSVAGTYSYAYRFSDDGGFNHLYCDRDPGTTNGFSTTDLGNLVVE